MELTTPRPVYVEEHPTYDKPAAMDPHEKMRALAAAHHARQQYPGPAGEVLAAEINAWVVFGYRGDGNSATARLIRELTR